MYDIHYTIYFSKEKSMKSKQWKEESAIFQCPSFWLDSNNKRIPFYRYSTTDVSISRKYVSLDNASKEVIIVQNFAIWCIEQKNVKVNESDSLQW